MTALHHESTFTKSSLQIGPFILALLLKITQDKHYNKMVLSQNKHQIQGRYIVSINSGYQPWKSFDNLV